MRIGEQGFKGRLAKQHMRACGPALLLPPADNPRTILVWKGQLRVQALPVLLFSGGHVAFIQRTPRRWGLDAVGWPGPAWLPRRCFCFPDQLWCRCRASSAPRRKRTLCSNPSLPGPRRGIQPICVHMTFQRWWEAGKVARLREFGLWSIDPPEYYGGGTAGRNAPGAAQLPDIGVTPYGQAGPASRFLTYDNGVLQFVADLERQRGAPVVLFEKNWAGLAYQLAALRCVAGAGMQQVAEPVAREQAACLALLAGCSQGHVTAGRGAPSVCPHTRPTCVQGCACGWAHAGPRRGVAAPVVLVRLR